MQCSVVFVVPSEDTSILDVNRYQNPIKYHYGGPKSLMEKIDEEINNPKKLSTTKAGEHISPGLSMSITSSFKGIRII